MLDNLKPKAILIQSSERFCIERFSKDLNFNIQKDNQTIKNELLNENNYYFKKDLNLNFINDKTFKFIKYSFQRRFATKDVFSGCIVRELSQDLFTSKDQGSLLFHTYDLESIPLATVANLNKLNHNFNKLAKILNKKGIILYFMPSVDKYNLYNQFIIENQYPKSKFFEDLEKLSKRYILINTKNILQDELKANKTKDLYYSDDTHWSYKASDIIFTKIKFKEIR